MSAPPKRILAVDFGDRRTGLAGTDFTGTISTPLPKLEGLNDEQCAAAIHELVRERDTELVVVGLPLTNKDEEGPRAARTREFVKRLEGLLPCPVTTMDERNTTDEAHALLKESGMKAAKRRQFTDSIAALVILRRYLC